MELIDHKPHDESKLMETNSPNIFLTFLPLALMSLLMAVPAHLLAKEKGRNVALWTVLALVPIVNFACIWFFIGAANLKLERKLDVLIDQMNTPRGMK